MTKRAAFKFRLDDLLRGSRTDTLRQKLALERPMTSLLERELLAISNEIVEESENWVNAYVDYGHAIKCGDSKATAYRAIDLEGALFWLVRRIGKDHGYHSKAANPFDAIEEAMSAWHGRREVKNDWSFVQNLMWDLIVGRTKFRVRIEDAYNSPLCQMGNDAFMARMGLSRIREVSGRAAALLMLIDPQVGFVLHQAHKRKSQQAERNNLPSGAVSALAP